MGRSQLRPRHLGRWLTYLVATAAIAAALAACTPTPVDPLAGLTPRVLSAPCNSENSADTDFDFTGQVRANDEVHISVVGDYDGYSIFDRGRISVLNATGAEMTGADLSYYYHPLDAEFDPLSYLDANARPARVRIHHTHPDIYMHCTITVRLSPHPNRNGESSDPATATARCAVNGALNGADDRRYWRIPVEAGDTIAYTATLTGNYPKVGLSFSGPGGQSFYSETGYYGGSSTVGPFTSTGDVLVSMSATSFLHVDSYDIEFTGTHCVAPSAAWFAITDPVNGSTVPISGIHIAWTSLPTGDDDPVHAYRLQVAAGATFSLGALALDSPGLSADTLSWTSLVPLVDGTTYTARVTAVTKDGYVESTPDVTFTATSTATPTNTNFVVLGDSYSAGEGIGDYESGTDTATDRCHRSTNGYFYFLKADLPPSLPPNGVYGACSGATIPDFYKSKNGEPPQLDRLGANTRLALLTIGGNDVGFANILKNCALSALNGYSIIYGVVGDWCDDIIATAHQKIADLDPQQGGQRLVHLYEDMAARAPDAEVLVLTYPNLFDVGATSTILPITYGPWVVQPTPVLFEGDVLGVFQQLTFDLNNAILNSVIAARADGTNIHVVNLVSVFEGHAQDGAGAWINGLDMDGPLSPTPGSFHPNIQGAQAIAGAVATKLTDFPAPN